MFQSIFCLIIKHIKLHFQNTFFFRNKYKGGYYMVTMDSLLESADEIRKYKVNTQNIYTVSEGYFVLGQSTLHQNLILFYYYH